MKKFLFRVKYSKIPVPIIVVVGWTQSRPGKEGNPMIPNERACPECGKSFAPETISSKYCFACAPIVAYRKQQERKCRAYVKLKEQRKQAKKQRLEDHSFE